LAILLLPIDIFHSFIVAPSFQLTVTSPIPFLTGVNENFPTFDSLIVSLAKLLSYSVLVKGKLGMVL
jgi:hypothetical protein